MHYHTWGVGQQRNRIFSNKFYGPNSDLGLGIYAVLDSSECMAALIAVNSGSGTEIFYDA